MKNKLKYIKTKIKNIGKNKAINIVFLICLCFYLAIVCLMTILGLKDINYYENRNAYKLPQINIKKIMSNKFQDEVEYAFSDQIIFSTIMKKGYNFLTNVTTNKITNVIFKDYCDNRYINLGNYIITFGCDDNLVYSDFYVSYAKEKIDARIKNINETIEKTEIPVYIYYIEKDTDINFSTNTKSNMYDYLKENINTNLIYNFEINNFDEFKKYFYKTDHHWNYEGSYKAYTELVSILTEDEPLKYKEKICSNNNFSGSKANFSGASAIYNEEFCSYTFDYPDYKIFINNEEKYYGNHQYFIDNLNEIPSYGSYYGFDDGEIIFDNNDDSKENILIFGESYDNAILKLIASHYNKTYSIDLRNYARENAKEFNYYKYIEENEIDKILLIGNKDFFIMSEFNLEV